jgi:hypothetical protein
MYRLILRACFLFFAFLSFQYLNVMGGIVISALFLFPIWFTIDTYVVMLDKGKKTKVQSPVIGQVTIAEVGPVFGRQFDTDLFDWIMATDEAGQAKRFIFGGPQIKNADDGTLVFYNDGAKSGIVINGFQYEFVPEPKT